MIEKSTIEIYNFIVCYTCAYMVTISTAGTDFSISGYNSSPFPLKEWEMKRETKEWDKTLTFTHNDTFSSLVKWPIPSNTWPSRGVCHF